MSLNLVQYHGCVRKVTSPANYKVAVGDGPAPSTRCGYPHYYWQTWWSWLPQSAGFAMTSSHAGYHFCWRTCRPTANPRSQLMELISTPARSLTPHKCQRIFHAIGSPPQEEPRSRPSIDERGTREQIIVGFDGDPPLIGRSRRLGFRVANVSADASALSS